MAKERMDKPQRNEGEGNRTADRQYRRATKEFAKTGRVPEAAGDARRAVDSAGKDALKRAEKAGLRRGRH